MRATPHSGMAPLKMPRFYCWLFCSHSSPFQSTSVWNVKVSLLQMHTVDCSGSRLPSTKTCIFTSFHRGTLLMWVLQTGICLDSSSESPVPRGLTGTFWVFKQGDWNDWTNRSSNAWTYTSTSYDSVWEHMTESQSMKQLRVKTTVAFIKCLCVLSSFLYRYLNAYEDYTNQYYY